MQLVYFRGLGECRGVALGGESERLAELMARIDCRGGHTQIGRVLAHAGRRTEISGSRRWFLSATPWRNRSTICAARAGELGLRGVPVRICEEGTDPAAAAAFRKIARLSGAPIPFRHWAAHHSANCCARSPFMRPVASKL